VQVNQLFKYVFIDFLASIWDCYPQNGKIIEEKNDSSEDLTQMLLLFLGGIKRFVGFSFYVQFENVYCIRIKKTIEFNN
jgi:hypothetical protein